MSPCPVADHLITRGIIHSVNVCAEVLFTLPSPNGNPVCIYATNRRTETWTPPSWPLQFASPTGYSPAWCELTPAWSGGRVLACSLLRAVASLQLAAAVGLSRRPSPCSLSSRGLRHDDAVLRSASAARLFGAPSPVQCPDSDMAAGISPGSRQSSSARWCSSPPSSQWEHCVTSAAPQSRGSHSAADGQHCDCLGMLRHPQLQQNAPIRRMWLPDR